MNPHLPFYFPPEFRSDVRPPGCDSYEEEKARMRVLMDDIWAIRTRKRTLERPELEYLRTRYGDELAYADDAVGRIVDPSRDHGLADETLVVVTGDHGEHLGKRVRGDPEDPTTDRTPRSPDVGSPSSASPRRPVPRRVRWWTAERPRSDYGSRGDDSRPRRTRLRRVAVAVRQGPSLDSRRRSRGVRGRRPLALAGVG